MKPLEVEILVAEVGAVADDDQLFHIQYDGTLVDERDFTSSGGEAEAIRERMAAGFDCRPPICRRRTAGPQWRRWRGRNGRWVAARSRPRCSSGPTAADASGA